MYSCLHISMPVFYLRLSFVVKCLKRRGILVNNYTICFHKFTLIKNIDIQAFLFQAQRRRWVGLREWL